MSYRDTVMAQSPTGYWRLGEASGTVANDETANTLTGTYSSGVALGQTSLVPGETDTAASWDGTSNAKLLIPANSKLSFTSGITLDCWIKPTDVAGGNRRLFWKTQASASAASPLYGLDVEADGTIDLQVKVYTGVVYENIHVYSPPGTVANGTIHHVMGTYDKGTSNLCLYVDDVLVGQSSDGRNLPIVTDDTTDLVIGWYNFGDRWAGVLDEVAVYDHCIKCCGRHGWGIRTYAR